MTYPPDRPILKIGVEDEDVKPIEGFSPAIQQRLRRAFTPRGMLFFDFYGLLRSIRQGFPVPDDLKRQFRISTNRLNQVTSPVDGKAISPLITNQIAELRPDIERFFIYLTQQGKLRSPQWRMLNEILVPLIIAVARDKGVYLKAMQRGVERWATFRPMTGRQEHLEKMQDTDPDTYALVQRYKATISDIDRAIAEDIQKQGLTVQEGFLAGRRVLYGVDSKTGDKLIFDRDGEILTPEEFKEKRQDKKKADARLSLVSTRTDVPLPKMRMLTSTEVDNLEGDSEWSALTDDLAKQGKLSRIFPTKKVDIPIQDEEGNVLRYEGLKVIVGGRYKGIFLDDMVNGLGRMIEGTAYTYSPMTGRKGMVPKRIDPSQREPYVTVADVAETKIIRGKKVRKKTKKLFLRISGQTADKELRNTIKAMACNVPTPRGDCVQSVSYHKVPGSRAAEFYFEPKDFPTIMDNLAGMSLSTAAMEFLEDYNRELSYAEKATTEENTKHYSAEAIGGFVSMKFDPVLGRVKKFDLLSKQKEALAWLEANGNKGVCALDTGIGKTLTTIAMMQKQIRDGMSDEGSSYTTPDGEEIQTNGRFLYVCPKELRGNLPSEIQRYLKNPMELRNRVDILSYREFGTASKKGKIPRKLANVPFWKQLGYWDAKYYVTIFFDEAHKLRIEKSPASIGALKLWHPRKVCLTASPMDKEPMEAYVLSAVCNNTRLFSLPEDDELQTEAVRQAQGVKRRFKKRYCEIVGGDVVGVKEDPSVKRELDKWIKRNVFYAEKTKVREFTLPPLTKVAVAVEMNPTVENAYRALTDQFAKTMRGLVMKWRERGGPGAGGADTRLYGETAFKPVVNLLRGLANRPQETLAEIATMMETDQTPDGKPVPDVLRRVMVRWKKATSPEKLREAASKIENPKLVTATEIISQKIAQTERSGIPSRTILFTDDKQLCMDAVKYLGQKIGGKTVVAFNDKIFIYQGTTPLNEVVFERPRGLLDRVTDPVQRKKLEKTGNVSIIALPLRKKAYKRHPGVPSNETSNIYYKPDDWQQFAFQEVINPDQGIKSAVLFGPSYQYGHNLQAFDTVIHLDRDSWSSEAMKQRTARAYRQGQKNPVDEYTLDATFAASDNGVPRDEFDVTLDQISRFAQEVGYNVFNDIMVESLKTNLGGKWDQMVQRDASLARIDEKVKDLMLSPYVGRSEPPGAR